MGKIIVTKIFFQAVIINLLWTSAVMVQDTFTCSVCDTNVQNRLIQDVASQVVFEIIHWVYQLGFTFLYKIKGLCPFLHKIEAKKCWKFFSEEFNRP